jgi:formate-dependent nitrite reductase cytochrome c552 subunit
MTSARVSRTFLALLLAGSGTVALARNEECAPCHGQRVADLAASAHATLACEGCHEGAAAHRSDPSSAVSVHFDLELCGGCHANQFATYVYGDDFQTRYGGSPQGWSKLNDFVHYNDIIDGYGFTREYNEERSHNVMLQDHHDVSRGKYDTCLQCKSTKVAYYWDSGQERTLGSDVIVQGGHMAAPITVPAGSTVTMATDRTAPYPRTHEVRVLVSLPDGTRYASYDEPGAIRDAKWTWSALYALTVDGLAPGSPTRLSGNGCNHCHDPHKVARDPSGELTGFRLIRKSLLDAIGRAGINPYVPGSPRAFDGGTPLTLDEGIALCAQCHVEYVCGASPIDGIDRDYFPWAKAFDLEDLYALEFPGYGAHADRKYIQDWVHGTGSLSSTHAPGNGVPYLTPFPIREELIKSQHPEAETYWGSRHYGNGAKCFVCHMPRVTRAADGTQFTSHWLASPLKYMSPEPVAAFAAAFGLQFDDEGLIPPCATCHSGRISRMKGKAERIQDDTYAQALQVQAALVDSLAALKAAKDALDGGQPVDRIGLATAADEHRAAHVRWENLVVSENSMGFHNPTEVAGELSAGLDLATAARLDAVAALAPMPAPPPVPPTMTVAPGGGPDLLDIRYDVAACNAPDHVLVFGSLGDFRTVTAASCSVGASGSFTAAAPAGDVWLLLAGVDGGTFSSLGAGATGERIVDGIPEACPALTSWNTSATCP